MGHTRSRRSSKSRGDTRRRERGDRDDQDDRGYAPRNQGDDALKYGGIAVACCAVIIGIIVATKSGSNNEAAAKSKASTKPKPAVVDPEPVEPPLPKDPIEALNIVIRKPMDAGDFQAAWQAMQKTRDKLGDDAEGEVMAKLDGIEQKIRTRAIAAFEKEATKIRDQNGADHDGALAAFKKLKARFAGPCDDEIESLSSDISAPGGDSGDPPDRPGKPDPKEDEPEPPGSD